MKMEIRLPAEFPFKGPSRIFIPNVVNIQVSGEEGLLCSCCFFDHLNWSPAISLSHSDFFILFYLLNFLIFILFLFYLFEIKIVFYSLNIIIIIIILFIKLILLIYFIIYFVNLFLLHCFY